MENSELEIVKKSPKTGDRFQATSHHENNERHALLQAGNRLLRRKFLANVAGPLVPKHLVSICLVAHGFSKMLNFLRKSKSSRIVCRKSRNTLVP